MRTNTRARKPEPLDPAARIDAAREYLADCWAAEARAHAETLAAQAALLSEVTRFTDRQRLPTLLTTREVAVALRVDEAMVRRLAQLGKIPKVQLGEASPRYRETDVLAYIAAHATKEEDRS